MAKDKKPEVTESAAPAESAEAAGTEETIDADKLVSATVAATMKAMLEQVLPAAIAAGVRAGRSEVGGGVPVFNAALQPPDSSKYTLGHNCPECHQPNFACREVVRDEKGRVIGRGEPKHRMAVVAPKDEDLWEWFQSPTINGVHYNSGTNRQPICVPAACDIEGIVQAWELREKSYQKKRSFFANSQHGGVIDYARQRN